QRNMISVINQLDRRRAQVLVEAVIAEVSTDLSNKIGATLLANGAANDSKGVVGYSNFGGLGTVAGLIGGVRTNTIPNVPNGLLLGGGTESFGAILEALKGDAATNILSTPTLVTLDNEEAEITVGQEVPFVTGKATSAANDVTNPFTTIERKDVGLKFRITPQINRGDTVNLKIEQETSNIASSSSGASDIITNKRRITTNVMVEDGQILVLGGLIEDNFRDSENKVPLLGDLPVVGSAFRNNSTQKTKNNLMVFIHPVILPDGQSADAYTRMKYQTMQQQQARSHVAQRGRLSTGAPTLPPDMNQVSRGSADALHNPPSPMQHVVPSAQQQSPSQQLPQRKCTNSSDPFCNGTL
ncbi:MAG: type II secretion system protein GspD, partial [Thiothrix sp.]